MMLSLLCTFSGGKELSLSKRALTTASGWPNLRSSVLSASLYNTPQYANSAMEILAFPSTSVFKYVKLTSSVKDCASMALLNCSNHSCHCSGSPLYCDNFRQWIVLLTSNCLRQLLYQIRRVKRRSRRCGMRRATPTQRVRNGSSIRWRNDRSYKGGGGTCGRTKSIRLHEVCCYVILSACCYLYMRGAERCSDMRVD